MTGYEPTVWVDNAAEPRLNADALNKIEQGIAAAGSQDSPTFTGNVTLPSTTTIGTVSSTELGYLDGVTSGIQSQLNDKAPLASPALTGTPTTPTAAAGTNTTQIASTAYVRTEVANIVNSAPATLDTLNEIAAALGSDPNFATTMTNLINGKVAKVASTDNAIVRFNGASGEVQDSGITIDDGGALWVSGTGPRQITIESTTGDPYISMKAAATGGTIHLHTISDKIRFAQIATNDVLYIRTANAAGELWDTGSATALSIDRATASVTFANDVSTIGKVTTRNLDVLGPGTSEARITRWANANIYDVWVINSNERWYQHADNTSMRLRHNTGVDALDVWTIQASTRQVQFDASPIAPTPTALDSSTKVATTEFVRKNWFVPGGQYSDTTDWNTVLAPGMHSHILLGSSTNGPGTGVYYYVTNYQYDGTDQVTQMAYPYTNDMAPFIRYRYGGTWYAWHRILTKSYADGVYSPLASPTFTGTVTLPSTTSIGSVDSTELGYLNGVTSAIQTQLNAKVDEVTSTDNAVARFDGTGGSLQNSGVTVDDSNNLSIPASVYVDGSASSDPYLRIRSVDGRTPYLVLQSVGANDLYMGWSRGNLTRFYFRCTQDTWSIRSADDTGNIWGSAPYGNVFSIDRTNGKVTLGGHTTGYYTAGLEFGTSGPRIMAGTGDPNGAVSAPPGSAWTQTDADGRKWHKASGTGNTGWLPEQGIRFIQTTTNPYTFSLLDAGRCIEMNSGSASSFIVPPNSSVPFPIGTQITVWTAGTSTCTLTPGSGVTLNGTPGLKLRAQWSSATLIKRFSDQWIAIGDLVS